MSAEEDVTPLEEHLSPASSQIDHSATGGSDTTGLVLGSEPDVPISEQSKPQFPTVANRIYPPTEAMLSGRPASPPPPRSDSQLEQEIKEWRQDFERTTLVLNSVSRDTFRELREDLRNLRPCRLYRSIKSLYISKLQRLELRKTSMLEYNASSEMGQVFMHEIRVIGRRERGSSGTYDWDDSLAFEGAAGELLTLPPIPSSQLNSVLSLGHPQLTPAPKAKSMTINFRIKTGKNPSSTWSQTVALPLSISDAGILSLVCTT